MAKTCGVSSCNAMDQHEIHIHYLQYSRVLHIRRHFSGFSLLLCYPLSREDPGQILSGYNRIEKFRNVAKRWAEIFVLLGGMLPQKILKIKCLRLAEIGFPTTCFEDSFISHSVTNCSCNWR